LFGDVEANICPLGERNAVCFEEGRGGEKEEERQIIPANRFLSVFPLSFSLRTGDPELSKSVS